MLTECWTPQSSHRDMFFSIYLVIKAIIKLARTMFNVNFIHTTHSSELFFQISYDYMAHTL